MKKNVRKGMIALSSLLLVGSVASCTVKQSATINVDNVTDIEKETKGPVSSLTGGNGSKPVETTPAESKPSETTPVESKPSETTNTTETGSESKNEPSKETVHLTFIDSNPKEKNPLKTTIDAEKDKCINPVIPTSRFGFIFKGWSLTENGAIFDFAKTPITKAMTFYSVFEEDIAAAPKYEFTNAEFKVLKAEGGNESVYGEFLPVANHESYSVWYKESGSQDNYKVMDNELLRLYKHENNYKYRFDIVGLKAGLYDIQIKGDEEVLSTIENLKAIAYDRSGFSFSKDSRCKTGSGAYNDDGTLKAGAKVVYVDASNAKTVKCIMTGDKNKALPSMGLQDILKNAERGNDILDIRIIGTINRSDLDRIDSSEEGLQVKGKSSYQQMNITIEGVGEDAAFNGFGILFRNAANIEVRNMGILNCMDDSLSLDTDNANIWIHNNDLFYGQAGGDADQAKGDGTTDVKGDSQYITFSYNHYVDSGKSSLCGMKSESGPNYITYHHNWFDHSDSRHPRIRTMSVHVYNNYYDGNAKYGVGVTTGSSAFVDSNYFRNCKYPMMISLQGSDMLDPDGKGTFSGESAGMIKAYGNEIIGAHSLIYQNSDSGTGAANATSFDAYLADTREEVIADTVVTKSNTKYDNFDTKVDLGVYQIDTAADARTNVLAHAGRLNGGDFKWEFTEADDADYNVNKALKEAVTNYKNDNIVSKLVYRSSDVPNPSGNEDKPDNPSKPDTPVDQGNGITSGTLVSFSKGSNNDCVSNNPNFIVTATAGIKKGEITYKNVKYTSSVKFDSKATVEFTLDKDMTLTIGVSSKTGKKSGLRIDGNDVEGSAASTPVELTITLKAGKHVITKGAEEGYLFFVEFN